MQGIASGPSDLHVEEMESDILLLGAGGAGLCAALHATDARTQPSVVVAVKGLLGRAGCTRMVQGGYNAVLTPPDSLEAHVLDTLRGGAWLNDQDLVTLLVSTAPQRVLEFENRYGCFFDRTPDGRVRQKPFAGQSHDRTVHKGDLTGIEIMNRLSEQVWARERVRVLEDHRAVSLLQDEHGTVGGALLLDMRTGHFVAVRSRATLLATGGGPTMYRVFACSADKAGDGLVLGFKAGADLQDMEMIQFHPTGLVVPGSLMTGALLEEGLRGAGGRLYNRDGERYMARHDPDRMERSTRDVVARANYLEVAEGRGSPNGGVFLDVSHLGPEFVEGNFRGMVRRCRDFGWDLARRPVEVMSTAHFTMGGLRITAECRTTVDGLFAAGEDAGGVHGANRLGGNGIAESTVFGGLAGDIMPDWLAGRAAARVPLAAIRNAAERACRPLVIEGTESLYEVRRDLRDCMWERAGLVRHGVRLAAMLEDLGELRQRLDRSPAGGGLAYNVAWQDWLNVANQLVVAEMIVRSALAREESRGSHWREDFPQRDDQHWLVNVCLRSGADGMQMWKAPVRLTRYALDGVSVASEKAAPAGVGP
jgi:fumarate reductase flavoprotein subunit